MRTVLTAQSHFHWLAKSIFSSNVTTKLRNVSCHSLSNSDTVLPGYLEKVGENSNKIDDITKINVLKKKVELRGVVYDDSCVPGSFYNLLCPKCNGGQSMERSLSFHIVPSGEVAMWRCFRFDCGWADRVYAKELGVNNRAKRKTKSDGPLTEESLSLMPLGDKAIAFFRERMISAETLSRNRVMQLSGNKKSLKSQPVIAFTYRRQGVIIGCKYRTIVKKFWQERDTEKMLYGLDDIVDADEIIIVEGEVDKLSMEEAGFRNCVSVPGGSPGKISPLLPPPERDTAFQYLWNCKNYLDKASRIILATDGDAPGRALAEELALRLGKDRCWKVIWPEKDELHCCKDANEVLRFMGPNGLKSVIENAEAYSESLTDQQA